RLLVVRLDPGGGIFFLAAADLADQDDRVGLRILGEQLHAIDEVEAVHGIAADPDRGGLSHAELRDLVHRLVRQRARAAHDPDATLLVDMPGHDPDLALAGRDDSGTVGADETRRAALHRALH